MSMFPSGKGLMGRVKIQVVHLTIASFQACSFYGRCGGSDGSAKQHSAGERKQEWDTASAFQEERGHVGEPSARSLHP
jgi:hypothetical protein